MSKLIYNGSTHKLTLIGKYGAPIGNWTAEGRTAITDGEYAALDHGAPQAPGADQAACGLHGQVRFEGFGVHSGAQGGIHTTEDGMRSIAFTMLQDPMVAIQVIRNQE